MIVFPNAKINLGIRVLRKREDGFHDLETIFYPIPLCDVLEITPVGPSYSEHSENTSSSQTPVLLDSGHSVFWSSSGNNVEGDLESNLCVRAVKLFDSGKAVSRNYFMHLHKVIPSGAGLGGGSSDAAFALKTLNQLEGSPFKDEELAAMSLKLGSDCPFFISNQPALAFGRGEVLQPAGFNLKGCHLILIKPAIHISTPEAFRNITLSEPLFEKSPGLMIPSEEWQAKLINGFETYVFRKFPEVGEIKQRLINAGAFYASMSGSGSAVFGLFKKPVTIDFPDKGYFVFQASL